MLMRPPWTSAHEAGVMLAVGRSRTLVGRALLAGGSSGGSRTIPGVPCGLAYAALVAALGGEWSGALGANRRSAA